MTLIASHRGGSLECPENSPTSFAHTAAMPVDQVEFDIHPTADGEIVVIHDATLDRTTSGSGPVADRTLAELRALTLNRTAADRIMTLAELAARFAPTAITLRMEVKPDPDHRPYPGLLAHAMAVIDAAGMRARTIVTSFQADTAAEAAQLTGIAGAIWLVAPVVQQDIGLAGIAAIARAIGVTRVGLRQNHLDGATMRELLAYGLSVGAWAVNDADAITRMLALGVDVFTTDIPTTALRLRG